MEGMNKSKKYLILLIATLLMGCAKDFLEVDLQGKATALTDPNYTQNLVVGVYNSLLLGESFGGEGDIHSFAYISATNIMSDDADKGSTKSDQEGTSGQMDEFTISTSNTFVSTLWSGYYTGISRVNQAIQALEQEKSLDKTVKNKLIGEMRFIRGYYYFNLVRLFGGVPKVLSVPQSVKEANNSLEFQTRASKEEIYKVIIADLLFANENLFLKSKSEVGRINKGMAQATLAKVYLYQKEWKKALDLTNEILNSNQYSLLPEYADIWRKTGNGSTESIFEIKTGSYNNSDYGIGLYAMCQGPRTGGLGGWKDLGWGFCTPTESLAKTYELGDKRKEATIIFIDNSGNKKGTILYDGFRIPSADSVQNLRYNYKAYHSEDNNIEPFLGNRDRKQKNIHVLRMAEVLLIKAEASNELSQETDALEALNKVRLRAGLKPINNKGNDILRSIIWHERRVELAMEHDRFFDIVRTGQAQAAMAANGKNFKTGRNEILPIPSLQIELSGGKLIQNPNY
jgi:starch-binding outer membrane protein, SusD/RagB family